MIFQSTPSAWRETDTISGMADFNDISIHSLRMEGDSFRLSSLPVLRHFNPLPPHGGRLAGHRYTGRQRKDFNPLPPHGGRLLFPHLVRRSTRISIHSLRMEGDTSDRGVASTTVISIHSLRMEGDVRTQRQRNGERVFQSTPSAWRET